MGALGKTQNWMELAIVQMAGAACLPMFVIGQTLAQKFGMQSALISIIVGNFLLMCLAFVPAWSSSYHKKSTPECIVDAFGKEGRVFFAGCLVLSMIGWFSIQLNFITVSMTQIISLPMGILSNAIFGLFITFLGFKGMQGLKALAKLILPVIVIITIIAVWKAAGTPSLEIQTKNLTHTGVSLVIAATIALVIDIPTFFRFAKSQKDAMIAAAVLFGCFFPLLEGSAVYLSLHNQGQSIIGALTNPNISQTWNYIVLMFLILAGCTANLSNLYSATIGMEVIFPEMRTKSKIIIIGTAATLLSCFSFMDNLEGVLEVFEIVLCSMGAVLIVHFLSNQDSQWSNNILSWLLGVSGGLLCKYYGLAFNDIPGLEAFIISLTAMGVINYITEYMETDLNQLQ